MALAQGLIEGCKPFIHSFMHSFGLLCKTKQNKKTKVLTVRLLRSPCRGMVFDCALSAVIEREQDRHQNIHMYQNRHVLASARALPPLKQQKHTESKRHLRIPGGSWLCSPSYVVTISFGFEAERSTCLRTGQPLITHR